MSKPFRLYKLPLIAIGEVLKQFDRIGLIDLAQCSKKSALVVRIETCLRYKLTLDYRSQHVELGKFKIYAWDMPPGRVETQNKTFGTHTVPVRVVENKLMETYWSDRKQGLEVLVTFLAKLFGMNITQYFTDHENLDRFQSAIRFLFENQKEIERLNINVAGVSEDLLTHILTRLKITGELWISSNLRISSSFEFPAFPSMLRLNHSPWFTRNHLLAATNCVRIALTESSLTNKDLDVFVEQWKAGEYPNLKNLDVKGNQLDNKTTIAGLAMPIVNFYNEKLETKLLGTYYAASIKNAVNIHRDTDGTRASLHMDPNIKPFRFQMIVWN